MKDIRQLFDLNIGLVLSGGGAKGAYEAGIFKALWELDIIRRVSVVSGTSIGTINGLMLSMNDNSIMDESWSSLTYSRFINHQTLARNLKISKLLKKVRYIGKEEKFNELLSGSDLGLLSQSGIREFIEEYVNFQIIKESNKTLYACAYNIDLKTPEYFRLNDYEGDELIDIVLASCAVPFIFKPIKINGYRYADGGINNPQYVCQNADNVPIAPLKHHNCDVIIVVHLSYKQDLDRSGFEHCNIVEIYPSVHLETISGIGTVNIMQSTLNQHIELGYRDGLSILSPMIIDMMKGKPLEKLIEKHETYNKELLYNNHIL
ncbi:MAG: patatin-like phospholipase family protein [Clostridium sp.]